MCNAFDCWLVASDQSEAEPRPSLQLGDAVAFVLPGIVLTRRDSEIDRMVFVLANVLREVHI